MLMPKIIIFIISIFFFTTVTQADVTLSIESDTLTIGKNSRRIPLYCNNPINGIYFLQTDIVFDTDCFHVQEVIPTNRTEHFSIFGYSSIEGGIRFIVTSAGGGQELFPGTGPIAEIIVDIQKDCPIGIYNWDITGTVAQDWALRYLTVSEIDGNIFMSGFSTTIYIESDTLCSDCVTNIVTLSLDNPDDHVTAVLVDILFDTNCFTILEAKKTPRSMDIFQYSYIEGGIRFAMTALGGSTPKGVGPIADFIVKTNSRCNLDMYTWKIVTEGIANPLGEVIPHTAIDGEITIVECNQCSLVISPTEFDFGGLWVSETATDTLLVTNVGSGQGCINIIEESCVAVDPASLVIESGDQSMIIVSCQPVTTGNCNRTIIITGCEDIEIPVTCYGVSLDTPFVRIADDLAFPESHNHRTTLDMMNGKEVASLMIDILFDTDCFDVTNALPTVRSDIMDIFNYRKISGGIRIEMTGIGHSISSGRGPIAEVYFDTKQCFLENYVWELETDVIVQFPFVANFEPGIITLIEGQKGDVNGDEAVNALDVVQVIRIMLGISEVSDDRQFLAADYDSDGTVSVGDVLCIVNHIIGGGNCPP